MTWIQPLDLKTIIIQIFAGNPDYFGAIAVLVITGMAGYFRMNGIGLFFMLGLFVLMFSGYIGLNFLIVFAIIGGLVIGYSISKMFR
jgi:hypothetical protein